MNKHTTRIRSLRGKALIALALLMVLLPAGGCGVGTPAAPTATLMATPTTTEAHPTQGVRPQGSNWKVQRYKLYDKVWASLSSVNVLERICVSYNNWKNLYPKGYVTTSQSGEAKLQQGTCFVYVYQHVKKIFFVIPAGWEVVQSRCEKGGGNCCASYQNCKAVVVTLPANVTFKGTLVTVIELMDEETTIVMTHEGKAEIAYTEATDKQGTVFTVDAGFAAFVSTPGWEGWAREQFVGLEPGTPFLITEPSFTDALARLGFSPQIRRLNALLASEGLRTVPDSAPPYLNAVIVNDEFPDGRVVEALASGADWGKIVDGVYPGEGVLPSLFYAPNQDTDEVISLRDQTYSPDDAKAKMAEAGYVETPLQIDIWYNSDQAGIGQVAQSLAEALDQVGFTSNVQSFNDSSVESVTMFQGDFPAGVMQLVLQLERQSEP